MRMSVGPAMGPPSTTAGSAKEPGDNADDGGGIALLGAILDDGRDVADGGGAVGGGEGPDLGDIEVAQAGTDDGEVGVGGVGEVVAVEVEEGRTRRFVQPEAESRDHDDEVGDEGDDAGDEAELQFAASDFDECEHSTLPRAVGMSAVFDSARLAQPVAGGQYRKRPPSPRRVALP